MVPENRFEPTPRHILLFRRFLVTTTMPEVRRWETQPPGIGWVQASTRCAGVNEEPNYATSVEVEVKFGDYQARKNDRISGGVKGAFDHSSR